MGWQHWLDHWGIEGINTDRGLRFDRSFMSISAAVDGLGVCLESLLLTERERASGRPAVPFCTDGPRLHCHSMLVLKSRISIWKIVLFREWLIRELGKPS